MSQGSGWSLSRPLTARAGNYSPDDAGAPPCGATGIVDTPTIAALGIT
ncbi:MAG: hypothetical protein AB7K04_14800 [Pseudorhodoplanes sp.]